MKKLACVFAAAALAVFVAAPAYAVVGHGGPAGPHYNLNIIGAPKDKKPKMTGSKRHTIFVALGVKGAAVGVKTKIFLTEGDFEVCDGNGFDVAYACDGSKIGGGKLGAVFQLPCNTNITLDGADVLVPCEEGPGRSVAEYEVWARALGQPGGSAKITTCAFDPDLGADVCSTENILLVRSTGKSVFQDVTQELTSLVVCTEWDNSTCLEWTRFALFSGDFEDWFWEYDNKGLRLAQLRFYLLADIKN